MTHCKPAFDHTKAGRKRSGATWLLHVRRRKLRHTEFMVTPNGQQYVFTEISMHRNIHVIQYALVPQSAGIDFSPSVLLGGKAEVDT